MDSFVTADYTQTDDPVTTPVCFSMRTTAEITALQTARAIGIGATYFDTTAQRFRMGIAPNLATLNMLVEGNPINGTSIGATTRTTGGFTTVAINSADSTGTPGNVTNNFANGRAAFAAAGTAVVVTNSTVAAADTIQITLLGAVDVSLTFINVTAVAAGSFTVTGNAAATAAKSFMFTVIKAA